MKILLALSGLAAAVASLAVAFILIAAINLPQAAQIGIWIIFGAYASVALVVAGVVALGGRDW